MKKIVVFSDGEMWELSNPDILVIELSEKAFKELREIDYPRFFPKNRVRRAWRLEDLLNLTRGQSPAAFGRPTSWI